MLSGGADASIHLWDLESVAARDTTSKSYTLTPSEAVGKQSGQGHHRFGITQLNFYPFDSLAFLSSSYDHSLKIYTTETLRPSASWDLESVVYAHAMSPIATHLMVACALQHPAVRLVDLRSGASTQALSAGASVAGGGGGGAAVLALQWSPHDEHVLASGSADGVVRLWDVRRSAAELITLDVDDAVGVVGYDRPGAGVGLGGSRGRAHDGAVNGVVWTDDGEYIVTAGHDNRIRVWEARSGANTLTTFGPLVKNSHLSTLTPVVAPSEYSEADKRILFYPNERDILCFDLLEGTLLKRLRSSERRNVPGAGGRNKKARVTCLAWKSGSVELYSAHSNGRIEAWLPRTRDEADLDKAEAVESKVEDAEDETRKRKRQVLEDVYRDLTRQKITFG
ncbi:MAG: hypothetical protein M1825_000174 [Sarcosagium campestre]|nr:MAG: hypothetical protein M1825_000174 [Sarcosagium campestre]